jgi:transposase
MSRHCKDTVAVLGIDIGKNTFHLVGLNKRGAIILRLKLSRTQLEAKLANLPPCLVGMEACVGAHHLSRMITPLHPSISLVRPCRMLSPAPTAGCRGQRAQRLSQGRSASGPPEGLGLESIEQG